MTHFKIGSSMYFSLHMNANKGNLSDVGGLNEGDLKDGTYGFCSSVSRQADHSRQVGLLFGADTV